MNRSRFAAAALRVFESQVARGLVEPVPNRGTPAAQLASIFHGAAERQRWASLPVCAS